LTDRPQPSATGTFEKTPLSHVLVYLHDRRLTGSLEIVSTGGTDLVHAQQGFPARIRTAQAADPLGRVLLELGLIDEAAFTQSLMSLGGGKGLQGRILIEQGALDLPGLVRGLREQLRRKMVKLFSIRQASYAYFDGVNLLQAYGGEESIKVDPYSLILSGVRFAYEDDRTDGVLRRLAGQALKMKDGASLDRFDLRDEDQKVVAFLREAPRTLEAVVGAGIVPPRDARALVYCFVLTHQVELTTAPAQAQPSARPSSAPIAEPPPAPVAAQPPPPVAAQPPPPVAAQPPPVPTPSKPPPPPSSAPPRPPTKRTPSAIRLPAMGRRPSRPDVPAPPPDAPPEILATREEIVARAAALDTEDYFVMLGASHEDSEEMLRSKYFALAKKYHPDRVPPGLDDLRETLDYVFTNLTEAYQTLTDGDKRRRYLELLREGSGTPADQRKIASIVDSAMNLQKAEVCLRRKNYEEAERLCRLAADANAEDGEAIGLLAWIQLHRREPGLPVTDLVARLKQAIDLVPRSEKLNFYLGTALKRAGDSTSAVIYFRRAADLNPRNVDAVREVRLFEMRRDRKSSMPPQPKKDEKVGLFGKLFGKK